MDKTGLHYNPAASLAVQSASDREAVFVNSDWYVKTRGTHTGSFAVKERFARSQRFGNTEAIAAQLDSTASSSAPVQ